MKAADDRGQPVKTNPITYANICFTPDEVLELDRPRPVVVVPRPHIRAIRLRYGFRARHPLLLAALGLAIVVVGLYQVPVIAGWFLHGGILHEAQVGLVVMTVFGGWTIWQSCRRGYLLTIDANSRQQTLEFGNSATRAELEGFLLKVESCFGYVIEREKDCGSPTPD